MSQYNAQCSALKDALPKDKLQHTDIHTVISSQGNTDNLLYIHLSQICTIFIHNYQGCLFFQLFKIDFSYFSYEKKFKSCKPWSEQVKYGPFYRGCR